MSLTSSLRMVPMQVIGEMPEGLPEGGTQDTTSPDPILPPST